jgi:hypothetical protein
MAGQNPVDIEEPKSVEKLANEIRDLNERLSSAEKSMGTLEEAQKTQTKDKEGKGILYQALIALGGTLAVAAIGA